MTNARCAAAALAASGEAARRDRPAPPAAAVRRADVPALVRDPAVRGTGDAGAALGRHVHRPLLARRRQGRGARARSGRLLGARHRQAGVLRADLDLHRPARRRASASCGAALDALDPRSPPACRSSGSSRPAPRYCAATSPNCCPTIRARARSPQRRARWPSCSPPTDGWPRARPGRRARHRAAALPPARRDWAGTPTPHCSPAPGARVDAVGGCCGLAGNFGVERGHYDVSVAVAETALLPAVRNAPHDAVVLADGFSCRTQLEQLGGSAQHAPRAVARRAPAGGAAVTTGFVPPPYPYERLDDVIAIAAEHDGGAVDLSIGTPCDPAPDEVVAALSAPAAARGYPPSIGTAALPRRRRAAGSPAGSARPSTRPPSSPRAWARRSSSRRCRSTSPCATRRATPSSTRPSATPPTPWARRSPAAGRSRTARSTTSAPRTPRVRCASG